MPHLATSVTLLLAKAICLEMAWLAAKLAGLIIFQLIAFRRILALLATFPTIFGRGGGVC